MSLVHKAPLNLITMFDFIIFNNFFIETMTVSISNNLREINFLIKF